MLKTYKPSKKSPIPKEVAKQIKKSQSSASKMIPDLEKDAVGGAPRIHKERRVYLRQQLTELLHILADKPGLLGPKMTVRQKKNKKNFPSFSFFYFLRNKSHLSK